MAPERGSRSALLFMKLKDGVVQRDCIGEETRGIKSFSAEYTDSVAMAHSSQKALRNYRQSMDERAFER